MRAIPCRKAILQNLQRRTLLRAGCQRVLQCHSGGLCVCHGVPRSVDDGTYRNGITLSIQNGIKNVKYYFVFSCGQSIQAGIML